MKQSLPQQVFPILLTVLTFLALSLLLFAFISLLNLFPLSDKIIPHIHWPDILVGLTIYLKTSIDFAIFIGNLMAKNPGWKKRIAIEVGTALGNGAGTFFVLALWTFFKEVPLLMILMIFLASLVLLAMAEEGLREFEVLNFKFRIVVDILSKIKLFLHTINNIFKPIVHVILPHASTSSVTKNSFLSLGMFSFTVPLILGLDDFAGYIPLFSIINVFGFALGVFLGHMLLNIALFASPTVTTRIVRNPFIILLGSLAFVGIAFWGFWEIYHLFIVFFH